MQGTPWQRLLKGLGANAFGRLVTVIIQIVSVPLFIHFWGVKLYGDWLVLTSIPAYFTLCDLGFGSAAANEMTMCVAQGDRKTALSVFQSAWLLISVIALGIILLLLSLIWLVPVSSWLKLTYIGQVQAATIILLMLVVVLINQQALFLLAGFQCEGDYAWGILYLNLTRFLEFLTTSTVVLLGAQPMATSLAICCAWGVGTLGMWIALHNQSPWIIHGYAHASLKHIKQILKPAIAFLGFPLGNALSIQGVTVLTSVLLGPTAVVALSTLRTLSRLPWQAVNVITNTLIPELSMAFGRGDLNLARSLHRRTCQASIWLAVAIVIGLAIMGPWIVRIWTNGKVEFDASLFYILLLIVIINAIWNNSQAVAIAINKHQQIALRYVVCTFLSLALAIGFARLWGLKGIALSLLTIEVAMAIYVVSSSLSLLKDSLTDFLVEVATPPVKLSSLLGYLRK
jgi:O-antigen/teichoic acid export membrane protein